MGGGDQRKVPPRAAVVGGGLVGALEALFLARRGFSVDLYEYREDIRRCPDAKGRSINLAVSERGRAALRAAGLEAEVLAQAVAMRGRLVHARDGSCAEHLYDVRGRECIYSVSRKFLNEVLLNAAERQSGVRLHFGHKLQSVDLDSGELLLLAKDAAGAGVGAEVRAGADLVVGADGAHSRVRAALQRRPGFDFRQSNIDHAYVELSIPPGPGAQLQLQPVNYLHVWPRGSFMLIALPNADGSWTATLFAPAPALRQLCRRPRQLAAEFFRQNALADALQLVGAAQLELALEEAREPGLLLSVQCQPYHCGARAVLMGDAAHAMVPFYGQGMNAGFEDCLLLDELLGRLPGLDLGPALAEFSRIRVPDAHAICDLAMYNYEEMRDLVARPSHRLRRGLDALLFRLLPGLWVPLYQGVTFSRRGYSWCLRHRRLQDRVLRAAGAAAGAAAAALLGRFVWAAIGEDHDLA